MWTVNRGSVFDNILVCDSFDHAKSVGEPLLKLFEQEKEAKKAYQKATGKDKGKDDKAPPGEEDEDDDDDSDGHDLGKEDL